MRASTLSGAACRLPEGPNCFRDPCRLRYTRGRQPECHSTRSFPSSTKTPARPQRARLSVCRIIRCSKHVGAALLCKSHRDHVLLSYRQESRHFRLMEFGCGGSPQIPTKPGRESVPGGCKCESKTVSVFSFPYNPDQASIERFPANEDELPQNEEMSRYWRDFNESLSRIFKTGFLPIVELKLYLRVVELQYEAALRAVAWESEGQSDPNRKIHVIRKPQLSSRWSA
jgi:hypothetical protein